MQRFGRFGQPGYLRMGMPPSLDPYSAAQTNSRLASQLSMPLVGGMARQYDDPGGLQSRQLDPAFLSYMDPQAGASAPAEYSQLMGPRPGIGAGGAVGPGQMEMAPWEATLMDLSYGMLLGQHHSPLPTGPPGQLSIADSLAKLHLTAMQNAGTAVPVSLGEPPGPAPADSSVPSGRWP